MKWNGGDCGFRRLIGTADRNRRDGQVELPMTGDQSRTLSVGERVCWGASTTDLGTVIGTAWTGVTIDWDDGHSTSIQHNDMAQVERVPNKSG
jgi:hypothetical protein